MSRRTSAAIVAAVILGVAAWAFLFTGGDEPEPCRPADGCVAAFTVDLQGLGLLDAQPARTAVASRNASDGLLVAVEGRRSDESERNDRVVVVEISAETGLIERTLVDRAGRTAVVEALVLSPDGTLAAVAVVIVEDDGSVSRDAMVIDMASGDVVSTAALPELARNCLLSFAADNSRFNCSGRSYDVLSGALLGGSEEFDDIDVESRWVRMGFRSALDVQADPDETGDEIRMRIGGVDRSFPSAAPTIEDPGRGELSFRPDGDRLIHHRRSIDPRRGEIVVYRTDDNEVVRRIQRVDAVHDIAWHGERNLVTISEDFDVVIYEID